MKKIYRSKTNIYLAGVCGGIGEHYDVDPIIIRIIFLIALFSVLPSITIYILLWVLMPKS